LKYRTYIIIEDRLDIFPGNLGCHDTYIWDGEYFAI